MDIILLILAFVIADATDPSDKQCLGWDTAEAALGGGLIGYAVGSHPYTLLSRVIVAGGGAWVVKDSFDREDSKEGCKVVAAVAGAAAGWNNRHQNPANSNNPPAADSGGGGGGGGDAPPLPPPPGGPG